MGVQCQILINRPKNGFHRSGSKVSGVVKYIIDEPTEYKSIVLTLKGKGHCIWTEHYGRFSWTYVGKENFMEHQMNILDNKENAVMVNPGSYEQPFEFNLPENLPSTVTSSRCSIKYGLTLMFLKPGFFNSKEKFKTEVNVRGSVQTTAIEGKTVAGYEKKLLKPFSKRDHVVRLKAEISNVIFKPGDSAELTVEVTNDTGLPISSVKVQLVQYTSYRSDGGKTKVDIKPIKGTSSKILTVPKDSSTKMGTTIFFNPKLNSIQDIKIIKRNYKVRISVGLPAPHFWENFMEIPVVVGYRTGDEIEELDGMEDQPPSYWEAMRAVGKSDEDLAIKEYKKGHGSDDEDEKPSQSKFGEKSSKNKDINNE